MSTKARYLPPVHVTPCPACSSKAGFDRLGQKILADRRFKSVYLRCRSCGAKFTRLVEIVRPPDD